MELHGIIRAIVVVIVLIGALMLLGVLIGFAGAILSFAFKALLVLLLLAIVMRFFGLLRDERG